MLGQLTCPACVATSSSVPRVVNTLKTLGLTDHRRPCLHGLSGRRQAAPDLFLFAAREMSTPPERCLVIEDSAAGIEAGLAAGMNVWRYRIAYRMCSGADETLRTCRFLTTGTSFT